MDGDERVLWRGGQDPAHTVRRWLRGSVGAAIVSGIGLAFFVRMAADRTAALPFLLPFLALMVLLWLVWLPVSAWRVRHRAARTTYVLTPQRLIIGEPSGETELRLANLPDLGLEVKGDGFGVISYVQPIGAGPEQLVRRLQRFTGRTDASELLGPVAQAQHVFDLIRTAQAQPTAATDEPEVDARGDGVPGMAARVADPEAPIRHLSMTEAAAQVPLWFSLPFLVSGIVMVAMSVAVGLAGTGVGLLLLGLCFAAGGGVLVRGRLRDERSRHVLAERGQRLAGRVVDIAATGVEVNRAEQWVVEYRYDVKGRRYSGHGPPMSWALAAQWAAGASITLLVDPEDPSRSVIADLAV